MPELPDVEVYKRYFDSTALHQPIADVEVLDDSLLDGSSADTIRQALRGTSFEEGRRHGKHLFARLDPGPWLALHFGMTGELKYYKEKKDARVFVFPRRLRKRLPPGAHYAPQDRSRAPPRRSGRVYC